MAKTLDLTMSEEAQILLQRRRRAEELADIEFLVTAGWTQDGEGMWHDPIAKTKPPELVVEIPKVHHDEMGRKSVVAEQVRQACGAPIDYGYRLADAVYTQRLRDRAATNQKPSGGEPFPRVAG